VFVRHGFGRIHTFDEIDAFFERFLNFFVIQAISGRILQDVCGKRAKRRPNFDERHEIRFFARLLRRARVLRESLCRVREIPENFFFFVVEISPKPLLRRIPRQAFQIFRAFFRPAPDNKRKFRSPYQFRQTAADDDSRKPHLQIRKRVFFERAGQLQRHQKIRRLTNAANQIVFHRHDRRASRAGRNRDVVETEIPGVFNRQRSAETNAAVSAKTLARVSISCIIVRKFLSQRTVMPYSERRRNPTKCARRVRRDFAMSLTGADSFSVFARPFVGSGSIFKPSIPTTPKPSFKR
jgi:hypothetical protein